MFSCSPVLPFWGRVAEMPAQPAQCPPDLAIAVEEDVGLDHDTVKVVVSDADTNEPELVDGQIVLVDDDTESSAAMNLGWEANYMEEGFHVSSLFPPMSWMPLYVRSVLGKASKEELKCTGKLPYSLKDDIIAGVTVGVMLVPQCLAFALLAGLPVQIGLYSSFAPLLVYSFFGTIRQVQPGPTALMSLLTGQMLDSMGLEDDASRVATAALLAFVVGVISLFLGMVRFGFVVDFMSHSVMAAFCTASGITIATSQLKHLLGINIERKHHWWQTAHALISNIGDADVPTLAIGLALMALLLVLKYWKSAGCQVTRIKHPIWQWLPCNPRSRAFKVMKIIADLSTLIAVVIGLIWAQVYRQMGIDSVKLVGSVDSTGFMFALPKRVATIFSEDTTVLMSGIVIAVVGFLETVAVGGKFAAKARYTYLPNQELIALGLANLAGSLMSGFPVTGSFSRTAVNAMLGATSLVACALSSAIVFLAMLFLLPVIAMLPLAALAPIIITGAMGVIDVHSFKVARKANMAEFGVMFMTFIVSLLLSVKEGLLVGFVLSVGKMMQDLANPNMAICGQLEDGSFRDVRNFPEASFTKHVVVLRMDARLIFANTRKMRDFCTRAVAVREAHGERIDFVIIDGKAINHVDLTGCEMLEVLAESLKGRNTKLVLANLKGPVSKCLTLARVTASLEKHEGHLCTDMDQAMAIVTHLCDGAAARERFQSLADRVEAAQLHLRMHAGGISPTSK